MAKRRKKNPAAVALGRLGGKAPKKRPAGFAAMTEAQRRAASRKGLETRLGKKRRSKPPDIPPAA